MLQDKIKLFSGSSHPELAKKIANKLNIELGNIQHSKFQCNESYIKIDETKRLSKNPDNSKSPIASEDTPPKKQDSNTDESNNLKSS